MSTNGNGAIARQMVLAQRLLRIPYCPFTPTTKQARFLLNFSDEVLYGGAARGAKSWALLMAALQFIEVPGYRALILRRTYPELMRPGGLIDVASSWFGGTAAKASNGGRSWTFPSDAIIAFGHMENEQDKYDYKGSEFQFIGFDELTEFSLGQYTYVGFSRRSRPVDPRNPLSQVPLRTRAATNPGGPGMGWVQSRFIDSNEPGRSFVPARLEDNPHVDQESYDRGLKQLTEVEYRQLRHGEWIKPEGSLMRRDWFTIVENTSPIRKRIRFWDLAATQPKPGADPDWTVGARCGLDAENRFVVERIRRFREGAADVERIIREEAEQDGHAVPVWIEEEGGASGKSLVSHYQRNVLAGFTVRGWKPDRNKEVRAQPLAAMAEKGNALLVRGDWNDAFMDEADAFPLGAHDDQVDAVSAALAILAPSSRRSAVATARIALPTSNQIARQVARSQGR